MNQINITQIENGFLIATPSSQNPITGQPSPGRVIFCESIAAVKNMLDKLFSDTE